MLRCKKGDLAIVIRSLTEHGDQHIGKVVRCVSCVDGDSWRTDPKLLFGASDWREGAPIVWYDNHLLPINPGDGEDEMLRLVGKPAVDSLVEA